VPRVAEPREAPKRMSTGQVALQIEQVNGAWQISCTGCGEASDPVEFRWQALEQTVDCRCG
jgi:hypothetical protein